MQIICDTNIWYGLARQKFEPGNHDLVPTFTAMLELAKTENHRSNHELVSDAIKEFVKFRQNGRMAPPFIYLKLLDHPDFQYDLKEMHGAELMVIDAIGEKNMIIEASNVELYLKSFDQIQKSLQDLANFMNEAAIPIKNRPINKKEHRIEDATPINQAKLSKFVEYVSGEGLSESFDWGQVELLMAVMRVWHNELELSKMLVDPNDIYDFYQLAYVKPGELFWTFEKKWIRLIKQAGMGHYLFSQ